jgi:hypothetical protein
MQCNLFESLNRRVGLDDSLESSKPMPNARPILLCVLVQVRDPQLHALVQLVMQLKGINPVTRPGSSGIILREKCGQLPHFGVLDLHVDYGGTSGR